ncbi:MAG: LPS export ABC transporter ATP-binding protein [Puniceicoccales bacterium]|jgi:lipopolysaccharide export system ATP-binding protein|nr:LPS export ABC transporter ATP-binding protein [Puniceicoccales bacterium]
MELNPMEKSKLSAENLKKDYGRREVVKNVSVEINSGEIIGLLGPNGAGKTVTFYMIMGLIPVGSGKIYLNREDISQLPMYKRARLGMGYLPQENSAFRKLTVWENLQGVAEYLPLSPKERRELVDDALSEMKISHLADQKACTLSGGECRRLEIARTLIVKPKFLLMDEPFSGVDPISVEDLGKIIISLGAKNIGIFITDHNVREMLKIVDRAYLIYGGEILCQGSSEVLLNDPNSRKLYLGANFDM